MYLHMGFVAAVTVQIPKTETVASVRAYLAAIFSEQIFDYQAIGAELLLLQLKNECVKNHLLSFAQQWYSDYYGSIEHEYAADGLKAVETVLAAPDWWAAAQASEIPTFYALPDYVRESYVLNGQPLVCRLDLIIMASEGRFYMETSASTFRFIGQCVRRVYADWPLAQVFRVFAA